MFLLCDSWYPKGCVAGLVNEYHNLDIICNARTDTVMYDLSHLDAQGNVAAQRNMARACHRKISASGFPKLGALG